MRKRDARCPGYLGWLAATVLIGLAVSACSGSSSPPTSGPAGGLILDINGPLSDPFFGAMKLGTDDAAKALGVNYQYVAPADVKNVVADYTRLLQESIGRHPAAMVVGDFVPSAFDPLIKQAVDAGIPVVIVNSGADSWQKVGALTYVGENALVTGEAAGTFAAKAGVHHLVCVNHVAGNPQLNQRCQGAQMTLSQAGGTSTVLNIPTADSGNPAAVQQDIQGFLTAHPETDGVLTLGSGIATDAQAAIKAIGKTGQIKLGTTDVSTAVLQAVKSGDISFDMDQQAYLQGFLSLEIAFQYLKYGIYPTQPIVTSGLVISKENVDKALAVQQQYPGSRGAR